MVLDHIFDFAVRNRSDALQRRVLEVMERWETARPPMHLPHALLACATLRKIYDLAADRMFDIAQFVWAELIEYNLSSALLNDLEEHLQQHHIWVRFLLPY